MLRQPREIGGRTVVITGASSGIGRATALAFAREGARVVVAARRADLLDEVAAECRRAGAPETLAVPTDVTDAEAVRALASRASDAFGGIDVWISNAGTGVFGPYNEADIALHRRTVEVNLFGTMHGAHAVLPIFKRQGHGVLINMVSLGGWAPTPFAAAYTASKFGIRGFTASLRQEIRPDEDIHVCAIFPAMVDTPGFVHGANMSGKTLDPGPMLYRAEDVAARMVAVAKHPQGEAAVGWPARAAQMAYNVSPRTTEILVGAVMRGLVSRAGPAPRSEGALLHPVEQGRDTDGGWLDRKGLPSAGKISTGLAIAGLAGLGITAAFALASRQRRRPTPSWVSPPRRAVPEEHPSAARYVRYTDDVETIAPDEEQTTAKIIEAMGKAGDVTRERYGRSVRTSHAKAHGLVRGELRVLDGLAPELRQGLFAHARSFPVVARLSHVPGELLDDRKVSCPRGMSLKIFEVEGPMLPGAVTQDWVLDTGKAFIAPDAKAFVAEITATEAAVALPEGVKSAVSATSLSANKALNAIGLHSLTLEFYGHPALHPLGEEYFSQAAIRYGDYIAKLGVFPDTAALMRLKDTVLAMEDENGLRRAVTDFFRQNPVEYVVAIQLCTDLAHMPVEDATVEWPEEQSPYRPVARLVFPPQEAYSPDRERLVDEATLFCPAHSLVAHRPLGSIMRARMRAYEVLGNRRREANGHPAEESSRPPALV